MRAAALAFAFLMAATPALAGLSPAQLAAVSVAPLPGARLDPTLSARDASGQMRTIGAVLAGHPGFVNFVDYTCNTLCGTELALLSQAIAANHLKPSQYRIVVIGIDPKDSPKSARAMARKEVPAALWPATTLLLPSAAGVHRATAALGFRFAYDAAIDQFAHPAVVYVVGANGSLLATLSPFALGAADLPRVLEGPAPAGGLFEQVRLLCYAYDPATGIYSLRIARILKAASLLTVLLLGAALLYLRHLGRRPA